VSRFEAGLARRAAAEGIGAWLLLVGVVGSGILADRLAGGSDAVALLGNVVGTVGALTAAILTLGPVSGAHLNPAVSLAVSLARGLSAVELAAYSGAQVLGAVAGVVTANLMFSLPAVTASTTGRAGGGLLLAESVATFGLVLVVWGVARRGDGRGVTAIPAWMAAGMIATASTCFANPAVTLARTLTDTFTGIRPADAPAFVAVQLVAAAAATLLARWLFAEPALPGGQVVVAHQEAVAGA